MGTYAWQTARLLAACLLSYGAAKMFAIKEDYWSLITAVVVTQPVLGDTLIASQNRIIGTLIGAATGFFVLDAARRGIASLPLFWCALIPLAGLTALWPNLRLSCVTLIVVVLVPSEGPPFERPLDRVLGILLGTLAAIAVSAVVRKRPDQ